ncbi:MAG TPA: hypothetical protein VLU43_04590 [Anaeromyxobacteraceae bacterium]|nr:hypothetical protein [Anaeromyxobacteraceae bacterium]
MSVIEVISLGTHAVELRMPPVWDAVKSAWEPCQATLRAAGLPDDEIYSLCMVGQELLENAVKYGAHTAGEPVRFELRVSRDDVIIEVKNSVGVDPVRLRQFDRAIQWIRGFQDPFEAYVERMKVVSAQPYAQGQSGLGLTRIAYEGRCSLDFYVDESNTLAVSAVYRR